MILCIGDLHIDANEKIIHDSHQLVLKTLDKVVSRETVNGTADVVLLGDCFDSAFPKLDHIIAFAKTLMKHDVYWHIIVGNHEWENIASNSLKIISFMCKNKLINGKVYYKPEVVSINDEKYFMCSHPHVVDSPPRVRYCFGHFGFDGAKSDTGFSLKTKNNPRGRWILGDYHTAQKGKTYIYPGSLTQVKFFEYPNKYVIRLENTPKLVQITPEIQFGRTSIESEEDLYSLDPTKYWSVNIKRNVKLPPDWSEKFPNIVKYHTERLVNKKQKVLMQKLTDDDPLKMLDEELKLLGLNDREIKRANFLIGRKNV